MIRIPIARAHVEAVELSAEIVAFPDHATMEVRVPIRELIMSEQPPDMVEQPNFDRDPDEVAQKHAQEILKAFRLAYDTTVMQGRVAGSAVKMIVIGASDEDVTPRPCAIYTLDFKSPGAIAAPARIVMSQDLFRLPPDVGFEQTVLCAVSFRQSHETTFRTILLGHDENLTLQAKWPVSSPVTSTPSASAPVEAPSAGLSYGPVAVLVAAGALIILMGVIVARRRV